MVKQLCVIMWQRKNTCPRGVGELTYWLLTCSVAGLCHNNFFFLVSSELIYQTHILKMKNLSSVPSDRHFIFETKCQFLV